MRNTTMVLLTSAVFFVQPAWAQDAPAAASNDTVTNETENGSGDIVVTGSARPQRRFDVSYAVNTVTQADISKIAPVNFADLIGTLPGIHTEYTAGEVQDIYRIRGLPGDAPFANFQQDGLPFFQENDGSFFRGDTLIRSDLMMDRLEVVRGGPAPIYASYAGAIINQITVTGSDVSRGKAQLTLGDNGLYRLDAYQAGPINSNTYYAIGGFIRQSDGYRDNGYPNDKGGQIRANIKHDFENGSIKFSANYVNDRNGFYQPTPFYDPRNPSVSLDNYSDFFTGTLVSKAFQNVDIAYRDGSGVTQVQTSDITDGRHMQMFNFGVDYESDIGGWLVSAKAGFTQGKLEFNAFYSTVNPTDGQTFADSYLKAARTAFGVDVARMGYTLAGTSTVYDPYQASGLVIQGQYRHVTSDFYSGQGDLSVTRTFDTGFGKHDLRAGLYASAWGQKGGSAYQDYLIEAVSQPRTLDLVAYSATGNVLGRVTDNGIIHAAGTLSNGGTDATMFALYANDTWEIVPGLQLDAGVRHDEYSYRGWAAGTTSVNMGDPTTLADDSTRGFTGQIINREYKTRATNWTVGLNYDFTRGLGAYARASQLEKAPGSSIASSEADPIIVTTKVKMYEAGVKLMSGRSYIYLTGFYSDYDPFNASFLAFDPTTGRNDVAVPFIGTTKILGVEMDGKLQVGSRFSINGALTVSNPQYKNFQNSNGADPSLAEGKQLIREPKIFGNIRPAYNFKAVSTDVEIYGRYNYTGKRYIDYYNQTAMDAFNTFGAGVTATHGSWQLQIVGDNIFNNKGITEGNTRTDIVAGQGTANVIYGRAIFGRNFRLVVSKSW